MDLTTIEDGMEWNGSVHPNQTIRTTTDRTNRPVGHRGWLQPGSADAGQRPALTAGGQHGLLIQPAG